MARRAGRGDRDRRPPRLVGRRRGAGRSTWTATTGAAPGTPSGTCIGLGRRRIAHIAGPLDQTASIDRLDGFRDVLPDIDPRLIAEGDFTPEGGARAMDGAAGALLPTSTRCSPPPT